MADMVTLESPDGRRYRTDSPAEITDLVSGRGYKVVDNGGGQRKQSRQSSSSSKQQQQKPAHEPDSNPVQPQTRSDGAT